jgi:hypothetical protein
MATTGIDWDQLRREVRARVEAERRAGQQQPEPCPHFRSDLVSTDRRADTETRRCRNCGETFTRSTTIRG